MFFHPCFFTHVFSPKFLLLLYYKKRNAGRGARDMGMRLIIHQCIGQNDGTYTLFLLLTCNKNESALQ